MNPATLLADHPLVAGFTPDDLEKLCAASEVRTFEPGETIIRRGEPGRFLGIVLEGRVEVVGVDPAERPRRLGELGEKDCFGEISLISGEPTTADVKALIPSRVLLIPHETFSAALAVHPPALQHLARLVTQRLRQQLPQAPPPAGQAPPGPAEGHVATDVKVLVIESRPTELRYTYHDVNCELHNREGVVEGLGTEQAQHTVNALRGKTVTPAPGTREGALGAILSSLTEGEEPLKTLNELTVIAHRVPYGGESYAGPVTVDDQVISALRGLPAVAPPEAPANLEVIELCRRLAPEVPQVAVFETAFYQSLPPHVFLYALPYDLYREQGVRRYGCDGLAHQQAALLAAEHLEQPLVELRLVTCCLGSTSSVCAVERGRAIDVSAGLGATGGLPGPAWPGDIDPAVIFHLGRSQGLSLAELETLLTQGAGLQALSGVPGALGELTAAAEAGSGRAELALELFAHAVKKLVGAYLAVLGGIDALVFTGSVGESAAELREHVCLGLGELGLRLDPGLNQAPQAAGSGVSDIAETRSPVKILVAPSDTHRMVASEALAALGHQALAAVFLTRRRPIPISISAHHVHLTQEHVEALYGAGHQLTVRSPLSQPGQFASEETVTLVGPRGNVERVRVLGPVRKESQVEISRTEEFKLGIDAPVRASGDIQGSPGLRIEGSAGAVDLPQGAICAARHVHMSPEDALRFGLRDRDTIVVRVEGGRGVSFRDVLVRVHPDFRLDMHVDTDEGNAAELGADAVGYIDEVERHG